MNIEKNPLTRRQFLILSASLVGVAALPSGEASAAPIASAPALGQPLDYWQRVHRLSKELKSRDKRVWTRDILEKIDQDLYKLEELHGPFAARLDELIEGAYGQERDPAQPTTLLKEYKKSLGALEMEPEDIVPFFADKKDLNTSLETVEMDLTALVDEYENGEDVVLYHSYAGLQSFIEEGIKYLQVASVDQARAEAKGQVFIGPDPGLAKFSPEGKALYQVHKAEVERFLAEIPYIYNTPTQIMLSDKRYGDYKPNTLPVSDGTMGFFTSFRLPGSHLENADVLIKMEEEPGYGPNRRKLVMAHELKGHRLSIEANPSLTSLLPAQYYIERARFEQEVMNNPDWVRDGSSPDLFSKLPHIDDIEQYLGKQGRVDHAAFMALITRYPRNAILSPQPSVTFSGESFEVSLTSKTDMLLGPVDPEDARKQDLPAPQNLDRKYGSLEEFKKDYMGVLAPEAAEGNIRAIMAASALNDFGRELANYDFVWDANLGENMGRLTPAKDKSARSWLNYLRFIGIDAVLYDVFINGTSKARGLRILFDENRDEAQNMVYSMRKLYRAELFAEGVAHDHLLGQKRIENNPFRSAALHMQGLLSYS